jgi:NAD(P)-dependent dehydrogenase (short-subunit alcohol dehydrogenase family)
LTSFDLSGKVALVTGGSRGIGRALVVGLARAGADVVIVSRKLAACELVAQEVRTLTGRRAEALACHVGHWAEIDELVGAVYRSFDRLDVLVNNAGMSPLYPDPESITEELFDKVLGVNLKGPFRLTALVGARMQADGGGSIVNIGSRAADRPDPGAIPYSAAKAGLNAMTVAFAQALGPSVRVNCIQLGAFLTDVSRSWDEDWLAAEVVTYALGRAGDPEEVVGTALYLASSASSFTTGAVINVDGGTP